MNRLDADEENFVLVRDKSGRRLCGVRLDKNGILLRMKLPKSRGENYEREFDIYLQDFIACIVRTAFQAVFQEV